MVSQVVRRASFWLLIATLVVLPFEHVLPDDHAIGGYTFTTVELSALLALGAWLSTLALDRRRPRLPRTVAVALGALLAVGFTSALLAPSLRDHALDAAAHLLAGALVLAAVADTGAVERRATWLATALVAGATASALVGLLAFIIPAVGGALGLTDFATTGARRLAGTLDYPNTAAMYYEAGALLAVGLALAAPRRVLAVTFAAAAIVLLAAIALTLSRGALIGLSAGLAVLALALVRMAATSRPRAWLAAAIGALVVVGLASPFALTRPDGLVANPPRDLYNAAYEAPPAGNLSDGQMSVPVTITNTGSQPWNTDGQDRFRLGFHWLTPDARRLLGDGTEHALIGALLPGETKVVDATVRALPPALGHVVAWDVFVPGQVWLSQYGVPVATTQVVSVGVKDKEPLPSSAAPRQLSLYDDLERPPDREQLWAAAVAMTAERPLLGHGPGTFQLRYGPYLGLAEWDRDIHANNTYLELASTIGLVGLAIFLVVVALVLLPLLDRVIRPRATTARAERLFAAALAAAIVAFLAHGAVDYFVGFNPTGGLFWAVLGLAVVAAGPGRATLKAETA